MRLRGGHVRPNRLYLWIVGASQSGRKELTGKATIKIKLPGII